MGVHCRASYSNTTVCRTSMDGRAMLPCVATASDAIPQTAGFPSLGRGFGASGEIWPQSRICSSQRSQSFPDICLDEKKGEIVVLLLLKLE